MDNVYSLFLACTLLSLVSAARICTSVEDLIHQQFLDYVMLERRGCPRELILPLYADYIADLTKFIPSKLQTELPVGTVCISTAAMQGFDSNVHTQAADNMINDLKQSNPGQFFLSEANFPDNVIPPLDQDQHFSVTEAWFRTMQVLMTSPSLASEIVTILPDTLQVFYDPKEQSVSNDYQSLFCEDETLNINWTPETMIKKVLAIVLRLELLGVPRPNSVQILKHCVAFVFKTIRAFRKEKGTAQVPAVYFPWYQAAFRNLSLTGTLMVDAVPVISDEVVNNHFEWMIAYLSSFESGGNLKIVYTQSKHEVSNGDPQVQIESIESIIFDTDVLNSIKAAIGMSPLGGEVAPGTGRDIQTDIKAIRGVNTTGISPELSSTVRDGSQCNEVYPFYIYGNHTASSGLSCCAYFCDNVELLQTVQVYTKEECCYDCNLDYCPENEETRVGPLAVLLIEGYDDEDDYIPVMI